MTQLRLRHALRPSAAHPPCDVQLRDRIRALLASLYPHGAIVERRRETRYPYPHLLGLTPTADDGLTPAGPSLVVVGKHLSENGLGFFHPQPLPHRRMIVSLDAGEAWLGLVIDLSWCRFTRHGWYESGGRFLQSVPAPLELERLQREAEQRASA